MKFDKLSKYSPLLLRTGIAIVFLWFGFSQLKNPAQWTRMVPEYASFMSSTSIIYANGIFEIVFATLLLLGLFTRLSSLLLTINLLHITTIVGYGPTGARDLALGLAALSIFFRGADEFCLDRLMPWKKRKENN